MKKSLLVLTAALTFGSIAGAQNTTAPASAPQVPALTDVPAGHWAKDAIDRLVSRGIILGYPDGTFRGTQNLTRYEAAIIIARLLDQINTGAVAAPQGQDLTALQNAVQELAADLAALGVRVSDLEANAVTKDDFARLEARVEGLGAANGNAEALAALQARIDDLATRADEYDALRADVDDNANSIAALNDLTVLLNQDILDLQDRVSAVEAAQADFVQRSDFDNLSGKVTAIDTRVTNLEKAPKFGVSGTISANYGNLALTSGKTDFDVDRLTRQTFVDGVFSTGLNCKGGYYSPSGNAVSCVDTNYGNFTKDSSISFGIKASNLTTANGKIVVNNAALNFGASNFFSAVGADGKLQPVAVSISDASADGTINGQKFDVKYHASRSSFKFNDYLFANDNANEGSFTPTYRRGVVANIEATQLPLSPKLTIVAGNAASNPDAKALSGDASGAISGLAGNYYGVRASINPWSIGTVGLAFAQNDGNRSALGADWDLGFGAKDADGNAAFKVNGVAVASAVQNPATFVTGGTNNNNVVQNAWASADKAFYIEGRANFSVAKIGAYYAAIDPDYANGVAGMSVNDAPYFGGDACSATGNVKNSSSMPYCPDSNGYGVAAATNLGPISLDAYYDSYTNYAKTDPRTNGFGVAAGVKFRGLKLVGFYNNMRKNNASVWYGTNTQVVDKNSMEIAYVPFMYTNTYGGVLSHDGKAADALVKDLNFTVADAYFYDPKVNDLQIYGDYSGTFAGVTLAPFARYHAFTTPNNAIVDVANANNGATGDAYSYTTVKYGIKASTQPMTAVPLQPSAFVNFAQRQTTVKNGATNGSNVAGETFVQAGVSLNRFLADNLKTSLGYAYYKGTNVRSIDVGTSGSGKSATFSPLADRIYANPNSYNVFSGDVLGKASGSVNGFFAQADWNGLAANYGIFKYVDAKNSNNNSIAQGFKVNYTFKF